MIGKTTESVIQFHWMIALTLRDREKTCFSAPVPGWTIDRAPIDDDKTLGAERFKSRRHRCRTRPRHRYELSTTVQRR